MSMQSEKVKSWRKRTKQKLIDGMGGKCARCGYNRCNGALDLHHIDEEEKEFGMGRIMAHPIKWDRLIVEAKKCVLLCCLCHRELHYKIWDLSEIQIPAYNLDERVYKRDTPTGKCPVCDKDVFEYNICCSTVCAGKRANKIEWPSNEELKKMISEMSMVKVAGKLGVSDRAVAKRVKKLNIGA